MTDTANPGASTGTDATNPQSQAPWFGSFDDVSKGHLIAKGWDKLDPVAAAAAALKSYKEAESKLGIPSDRVVRWPDPTDTEGMKAVYQRLGVPADATGYDFSAVKNPDGSALAEDFDKFLRDTALKLNMPKDAAAAWASSMVERDKAAQAAAVEQTNLRVASNKDALSRAWGGDVEMNTFVARRAASMLGYSDAEFEALTKDPQYVAKMQGLLVTGRKMGEAPSDGINNGAGGSSGGRLTPVEAQAKLADLMSDQAWVKRRLSGDKQANDEFRQLTEIMANRVNR